MLAVFVAGGACAKIRFSPRQRVGAFVSGTISVMSDAKSTAKEFVNVEVTYALAHRQELVSLRMPVGSTLQQAIEKSGLLEKYPEIDLAKAKTGIYGKLCKADTVLRDCDRVEIYRPLIADPKEVRKQRAAEGKAMKKGGGTEVDA